MIESFCQWDEDRKIIEGAERGTVNTLAFAAAAFDRWPAALERIAELEGACHELLGAYEDACWQGSGNDPLSTPTWHNFTSSWEEADELIPRMRRLLSQDKPNG